MLRMINPAMTLNAAATIQWPPIPIRPITPPANNRNRKQSMKIDLNRPSSKFPLLQSTVGCEKEGLLTSAAGAD